MEQTRILCVDDERNVLRALERIFMDFDYEILTASSGQEGLELLNAAPEVQVVISDYRMPGMNGVEFLSEVFKAYPQTIRIVLSGYADTAAVVAAINEGQIYKFIPKPWNDDELRMTVAKALETFAIQKRNVQLAEELRLKNEELCALNANLERLVSRGEVQGAPAPLDILQQLPVGVLVLGLEGAIRQLNREAAALLGVKVEEAVGRPLHELLPAELPTPEALSGCTTLCRTVKLNGRLLTLKAAHFSSYQEPAMLLALTGE